jgi:6-phosphofructokinase 1
MNPKNAFYAQSGGVTAVINASACGVIETCRQNSNRIGNVFAGHNGIIGALCEELIDTSRESDADIAALKNTPSGAWLRNILQFLRLKLLLMLNQWPNPLPRFLFSR